MNLFDQLQQYDTKVPDQQLAPKEPSHRCIIKNTKYGRDIMICTTEPAPPEAISESREKGLPLFTPSEINYLAGAHKETVEEAIRFKAHFSAENTIATVINNQPAESNA